MTEPIRYGDSKHNDQSSLAALGAGLPLLGWPIHRQQFTILIYHRVLPVQDPCRFGEIEAKHFDRQMHFLAEHFTVLHLREAVDRLQRGKLPRRACCITFDDGYADNLTIAQPILEKYSLPATVFVATGYLDGGRMFNDSVIDAIANSPIHELDLDPIGLGRYPLTTSDQKRAAIVAILEKLKYQPPGQRTANVDRLVELAECGALPSDIMLTSQQVGELSRRGVEIGGHTVAHTILTTLDDATAEREILAGKQHLESLTGRSVTTFAYPNGRPHRDYETRHVAMVRKLGFEVAVSTAHGVSNSSSDIHQLPRFVPWGQSVMKLAARMMRNAWNTNSVICKDES
jgi:peptidoglycan/xylan/chitin deacetylase (PgdA/CDA1 family)